LQEAGDDKSGKSYRKQKIPPVITVRVDKDTIRASGM